MDAPYLQSAQLLDPEHACWGRVRGLRLGLRGTPAALQPTAAIRTEWAGKPIGAVPWVEVSAAHDGERLALRLEWPDARADRVVDDTTVFVDGAAILFPLSPEAPLATMGKPGAPVNAWYWRADRADAGRQVVAEGLGTTRPLAGGVVEARGTWAQGRWRVVIARSLHAASREAIDFRPGAETHFAVAVWDGSAAERAGLKAFSLEWQRLGLAPVAVERSA